MSGISPQAAGIGGGPGGGGTPPRNQNTGPNGHKDAPGAPHKRQRTEERDFTRRTLKDLKNAMEYEENQLHKRAGSPPPECRDSNKRSRTS